MGKGVEPRVGREPGRRAQGENGINYGRIGQKSRAAAEQLLLARRLRNHRKAGGFRARPGRGRHGNQG